MKIIRKLQNIVSVLVLKGASGVAFFCGTCGSKGLLNTDHCHQVIQACGQTTATKVILVNLGRLRTSQTAAFCIIWGKILLQVKENLPGASSSSNQVWS